jgi:hypothetical protein
LSGVPAPEQEVTSVITQAFDALGRGDRELWLALTTPDFHIFENGLDMSRDELFALVRRVFQKGDHIAWRLTSVKIVIDQHYAALNYVNKGAITSSSGVATPTTWHESAVLRRSPNAWRIMFMQSERAKML